MENNLLMIGNGTVIACSSVEQAKEIANEQGIKCYDLVSIKNKNDEATYHSKDYLDRWLLHRTKTFLEELRKVERSEKQEKYFNDLKEKMMERVVEVASEYQDNELKKSLAQLLISNVFSDLKMDLSSEREGGVSVMRFIDNHLHKLKFKQTLVACIDDLDFMVKAYECKDYRAMYQLLIIHFVRKLFGMDVKRRLEQKDILTFTQRKGERLEAHEINFNYITHYPSLKLALKGKIKF